jgi:hypothetical protein
MSIRIPLGLLIAGSLFLATELNAQTPGRRRALLIGINDYSASTISARPLAPPAPGRDWPNLSGAVTDAGILQQMLPLLYGFDPHDVVTLIDQSATRNAILRAVDDLLLKPAEKGDVLLFYFAGHGSQVRNSLSDEPDKLDESLVPADSRLGVPDIRDKELRRLFNLILDRGARLTVILDNCHSGSGARGLLTGLRPRGLKADRRDIADSSGYGPRPEERGALVLSAAEDFDRAWETRDEEGTFHGAFTWALLRAMRDAEPNEPARDTFLRAQARLRAETPYQEPVMAGNVDARFNPLLATRTDRRIGDRAVVAIEKIRSDGTIVLQGGWVNGLAKGTELRVATESRMTRRLVVTAVNGLTESYARLQSSDGAMPLAIHPGALLEVVGWAAPPGRAMRVSMPRAAMDVKKLTELARLLNAEAAKHNIRWLTDPTAMTQTHLLHYTISGWELVDTDGNSEMLGSDRAAVAAVARLPNGASLFVQFPAPAAVIDNISVGPGTDRDGIEPADQSSSADYVLAGRYSAKRISYAWLRPSVKRSDRRRSGLPVRTTWISLDGHKETLRDGTIELRDAVLRLRRIHAWQLLESPRHTRSPYFLALRRERDDEIVRGDSIAGGERYGLLLRARSVPLPTRVEPRYVYVFTVDSWGNSTLLFPRESSVENRLPPDGAPPREIPLGAVRLEVEPPYGVDTYYLLTTDEPLPDPGILEWNGVRTRGPNSLSPLQELLALTGGATRGVALVTPTTWSIERFVCESVPERKRRGRLRSSP